jgi:DNA anti-recombination protein RmuC
MAAPQPPDLQVFDDAVNGMTTTMQAYIQHQQTMSQQLQLIGSQPPGAVIQNLANSVQALTTQMQAQAAHEAAQMQALTTQMQAQAAHQAAQMQALTTQMQALTTQMQAQAAHQAAQMQALTTQMQAGFAQVNAR